MENKFESDFKCHPLTKEQQDEAFREFDRQQQKSLERLAQMIESDPKLRAQHEAARRHEHLQKFGSLDFSKLEDRVMANAVMGRMSSTHSNTEEVSPTFRHTSGIVRGVVQRYPRMSDNLPRDGRIKVDVAPGKRMLQTDIHLGDVKTSDLSEAFLQTISDAYGLTPDQMNDGGLVCVDETTFIPGDVSDRRQVPACGRALRIAPKDSWSAERRDRAATSAPVRKKLRAKTRAQKKARRKQR